MKQKAFLVDIDGTLMDISKRRDIKPFIVKEGDLHWYNKDMPNPPVVETVKALIAAGYQPLFVSGRSSIGLSETLKQIAQALQLKMIVLYTRVQGDFRKDVEVKKDIYQKYIESNYDILLALDDRDSVVAFWRSMGIPCFQVAEGNF